MAFANRASARPYPIVSAEYCVANGITPKAIASAAVFNERLSSRRGYEASANTARRLRALEREVDAMTGYYTQFRGRTTAPANDNPRRRRAA